MRVQSAEVQLAIVGQPNVIGSPYVTNEKLHTCEPPTCPDAASGHPVIRLISWTASTSCLKRVWLV